VLICDDEPDVRLLYRAGFEAAQAKVFEAEDGVIGIEQATRLQPRLIVLDIAMPRRDGLSVLPELRVIAPHSTVVVVTAHSAVEVFQQARTLGAAACFEKLAFLERIPAVLAKYASADAGFPA